MVWCVVRCVHLCLSGCVAVWALFVFVNSFWNAVPFSREIFCPTTWTLHRRQRLSSIIFSLLAPNSNSLSREIASASDSNASYGASVRWEPSCQCMCTPITSFSPFFPFSSERTSGRVSLLTSRHFFDADKIKHPTRLQHVELGTENVLNSWFQKELLKLGFQIGFGTFLWKDVPWWF